MNENCEIDRLPRHQLAAAAALDTSCAGRWGEQHLVRTLHRRPLTFGIGAYLRQGRQRNLDFEEGTLIGFAVWERTRRRIDVLRLTVHPGHRRRGIGRALLREVLSDLTGQRRRCQLLVCETAQTALFFFRACGFLATSLQRDGCDCGRDLIELSFERAGSTLRVGDLVRQRMQLGVKR